MGHRCCLRGPPAGRQETEGCERGGVPGARGRWGLRCRPRRGWGWGGAGAKGEGRQKAYSTRYSQAVSHPSTNQARPCLASEIRRDRARSGWYGRRRRRLPPGALRALPPRLPFAGTRLPLGPAGRTSPRGRVLYLSRATRARPTPPRPRTPSPPASTRLALRAPGTHPASPSRRPGVRAYVRAGRGGLGALPPRASAGPPPPGGAPNPIPFAAQGQVAPEVSGLRARRCPPPAGL